MWKLCRVTQWGILDHIKDIPQSIYIKSCLTIIVCRHFDLGSYWSHWATLLNADSFLLSFFHNVPLASAVSIFYIFIHLCCKTKELICQRWSANQIIAKVWRLEDELWEDAKQSSTANTHWSLKVSKEMVDNSQWEMWVEEDLCKMENCSTQLLQ